MAKIFAFAIERKEQIIGVVLIFDRVDKIGKSCEKSCGKALGIAQLRKGEVVSKKKAKGINDGKCFHESAFTCKELVGCSKGLNHAKKQRLVEFFFF
jgi:hypothetical protein